MFNKLLNLKRVTTENRQLTALFNNLETLKFKTQPTGLFFTASDVSGSNDALHKMVNNNNYNNKNFILPEVHTNITVLNRNNREYWLP